MARIVPRSARSGRFVSVATVRQQPRTTVTQVLPNKSNGKSFRSAISGKYVSEATAKRHPSTTIAEGGA